MATPWGDVPGWGDYGSAAVNLTAGAATNGGGFSLSGVGDFLKDVTAAGGNVAGAYAAVNASRAALENARQKGNPQQGAPANPSLMTPVFTLPLNENPAPPPVVVTGGAPAATSSGIGAGGLLLALGAAFLLLQK